MERVISGHVSVLIVHEIEENGGNNFVFARYILLVLFGKEEE